MADMALFIIGGGPALDTWNIYQKPSETMDSSSQMWGPLPKEAQVNSGFLPGFKLIAIVFLLPL
jgi:hypothetical protein